MSAASPALNNRSSRTAIKIVVSFLIILVIAVASIDFKSYSPKLAQIVANAVRPSGVVVKFENPLISLTSITADTMSFTFIRALLTVVLGDVNLKVNPVHLLRLSPTAQLSASAYGGTLASTLSFSILAQSWAADVAAEKIKLAEHPLFMSYGVHGELALRDSHIKVKSPTDRTAEFHATINSGSKPTPSKVTLYLFNAPVQVAVPAVQHFDVTLDGNLSGSTIEKLELVLNSSLGLVSVNGSVFLSERDLIERVNLVASVALTDAGKKEFGPWLALLSGNAIDSKSSEFKAAITGLAIRPDIRYFDIQ